MKRRVLEAVLAPSFGDPRSEENHAEVLLCVQTVVRSAQQTKIARVIRAAPRPRLFVVKFQACPCRAALSVRAAIRALEPVALRDLASNRIGDVFAFPHRLPQSDTSRTRGARLVGFRKTPLLYFVQPKRQRLFQDDL